MPFNNWIPGLLTDSKQLDDLLGSAPQQQDEPTTLLGYALALAEAQKRASGLQDQSAWLLAQLNKPDAKNKNCADALKEWRAQP